MQKSSSSITRSKTPGRRQIEWRRRTGSDTTLVNTMITAVVPGVFVCDKGFLSKWTYVTHTPHDITCTAMAMHEISHLEVLCKLGSAYVNNTDLVTHMPIPSPPMHCDSLPSSPPPPHPPLCSLLHSTSPLPLFPAPLSSPLCSLLPSTPLPHFITSLYASSHDVLDTTFVLFLYHIM